MPGDFLSIPEAAAILGVSRIAVFKRVKSGHIPAFRAGRSWIIARRDISATAAPAASAGSAAAPAAKNSPAKKPPLTHPPSSPPPAAEAPGDLDSMGWD
ncbi:MAG TPA: helix-turn-helix domain-containing protein [Elusimicrobiales bacterium]|nr:helix-turn-helix domain-containing protein [Elusimicrobiales bacterium]